jgi:hypothetical protein
MAKKLFIKVIYVAILAIFSVGCAHTQFNNQSQSSPAPSTLSENKLNGQASSQICPTPPSGYEKMPGYKVGKVDPSLSQNTLEIISPATMALGRALISDVFTTIEFCGTAKNNLVKVKLFTSNAGIKENQISLESVKYPIGETKVKDGLWFISYQFTKIGNRAVLARGYDKDDKLVATSSPVALLQIYSPNP